MTGSFTSGFLYTNRRFIYVAIATAIGGLLFSQQLHLSPVMAVVTPLGHLALAIGNRSLFDRARELELKKRFVEVVVSLSIVVLLFMSVVVSTIPSFRAMNLISSVYYSAIVLQYLLILIYWRW